MSHLNFLIFVHIYKHLCFEISLTDQLALRLTSKIHSQKDILFNYFEFAKKLKNGSLSCPKKPYNGKINLELCHQLLKKIEWGQIEKSQKNLFSGKRRKDIRNTEAVIHEAENLGLVSLLEPYSDKDSTMEHEHANCHAMYDASRYKKRRKCHNQESRSTVLTSKPTFRFDSSLQRRTNS